MVEAKDLRSSDEIAWCPGCGNFGILNAVKRAVTELGRNPKDILFVSGIGQAAKLPQSMYYSPVYHLTRKILLTGIQRGFIESMMTIHTTRKIDWQHSRNHLNGEIKSLLE